MQERVHLWPPVIRGCNSIRFSILFRERFRCSLWLTESDRSPRKQPIVNLCAQSQPISMTCLSTRLRREQAADWAVSWLLFALCSVLLPGVEAATAAAAAASKNVWPPGDAAQWDMQCSLSTVITIASLLTATVITIASVLTATAAPADRPHATTNDSGASQ